MESVFNNGLVPKAWINLVSSLHNFLKFFSSDLKRRVSILIDGSLIIAQVKPEDAGTYTCAPSNSLGQPPTASAYLTVQCKYLFMYSMRVAGSWFLRGVQPKYKVWSIHAEILMQYNHTLSESDGT